MKHINTIKTDKELQNKIKLFVDEYFTNNDKKLLEQSKFRIDLCGFDSGTYLSSNDLGVFTYVPIKDDDEYHSYNAIFLRTKLKNTTCNLIIAHELVHLLQYLRNDWSDNTSYRKNSGLSSGHGPSFYKIADEIFGEDYTVIGESTNYDYLSFEIKKAEKDKWWARFRWIFNESHDLYKDGTFTKTEMLEITDLVINTLIKNKQINIAEELIS